MEHSPRATIDFESRSACSLRASGSWRYSLDASTEVLCLAFRLPFWEEGRTGLWHPAFAYLGVEEDCTDLDALFDWIAAGECVEAHDAWFERGLWENQLAPLGWPCVNPAQWQCSAAKAAAHALPRGLAESLLAQRLTIGKDTEGAAVMKKMAKPRQPVQKERMAWGRQHDPCAACKATGKHKVGRAKATPCEVCAGRGYGGGPLPPMPRLYHESREQMERLWAYCRQDVLAEEALSQSLPDLSAAETALYLLDQRINARGFQLDAEAVDAALHLIDGVSLDLNAELAVLTGGVVQKATQRARMMVWLETEGVALSDTRKETLDAILEGEEDIDASISSTAYRAIELMRMLGRSSTAKYLKMRDWMSPDHRVHGGLLYHGASTGRWTGVGIQPQNFPKAPLPGVSQDELWPILKTRDVDAIIATYGDGMKALSHGLRGAIVAPPGRQLYVADYASIEARVVLWLAGDEDALQVFRNHEDIYCYMASDIYGYLCTKEAHPTERSIGKIAVLGLGYQMGWKKFMETCATAGVVVDEAFAQRIVDTYREKFWRVKELWRDQEAAAMWAVQTGEVAVCGRVSWHLAGDFLYGTLPSGRRLAYPDPLVRPTKTSWGAIRDQLTFMGLDTYTRQWKRLHTYGGMLVENLTQAVARDVMAEALVRCEASGAYQPVLTVHDEVIAEAGEGVGDVAEFEGLLSECPVWAAGLPIEAEGWRGHRYHK